MLKGRKIGFIGGGQMCEAIFSGALAAGAIDAGDVLITDILAARLDALQTRYGVGTTPNDGGGNGVRRVAESCEIVILAIKPQLAGAALAGAGDAFGVGHLVISIIGGTLLKTLEEWFPKAPLIRVVPNTPMLVGIGCAGITPGRGAGEKEVAACRALFDAVGESYQVPENMLNPFTAVGGCGPAYAYMFIEALADGGVEQGLPRAMAQQVAAQMLAGAAGMVLRGEEHPGRLKDHVCSPGGGTIAGVHALESGGFRAAVIDAVAAGRRRMDALG